jgi:hypothetical protein
VARPPTNTWITVGLSGTDISTDDDKMATAEKFPDHSSSKLHTPLTLS